MAEGLNKVMLLGNLGADPELRATTNSAVLKLRLATTRTWKSDKTGKQEETEWHSVVIWGNRAEALSRILNKGDRIFVEGRIATRSYDKDGEKRYTTEIVAENILLQGGNGGRRDSDSPKGQKRGKAQDDGAFPEEDDDFSEGY